MCQNIYIWLENTALLLSLLGLVTREIDEAPQVEHGGHGQQQYLQCKSKKKESKKGRKHQEDDVTIIVRCPRS